jgi:hypothetical protein
VSRRVLLATEWALATTVAVVVAHLAVEIVGAALLGYALLLLLPFIGGVVGGLPIGICQWYVLRRRWDSGGSWIAFTLLGFFGAWAVAVILAALMFVPLYGLDESRTFFAFVIPTPIVGLSQSIVVRRWSRRWGLWVVASTIGWATFVAVEIFAGNVLPEVNQLTGRLVSMIAGYPIASVVGATLLGGLLAGTITGTALTLVLQDIPNTSSGASASRQQES